MSPLATTQFQTTNAGWDTKEPDFRPSCTRCTWSWAPTEDDDPFLTRAAAATFARRAHRHCAADRPAWEQVLAEAA